MRSVPRPPRRTRRLAALAAAAGLVLVAGPRRSDAAPPSLSDDGRVGVVADLQGSALVRPAGRQRWSPLGPRSVLLPGDEIRTLARGAHAAEVRLAGGGSLVLGPDTQTVLDARTSFHVLRGECEVVPPKGGALDVAGPGKFTARIEKTTVLRAADTTTTALDKEPRWLTGYRGSTTDEWMGSLLAKVDGRNVPLSVGYHSVTVTIRDQIAETVVEESFVNATDTTLEGVFSFPLPADASVSGFGMWIGDELVEADIVERDRARQIYEDIKARKKDPGLLEWSGGNVFTANVFPIPADAEKRVRLRYTQVLPLEGTKLRYRYALRSEMLRTRPLRELAIRVTAESAVPFAAAASPTHEVRTTLTGTTASAEFRASQFTPDRDFEAVFDLSATTPLRVVPHRRGEDGYFMVLLAPPDTSAGAWKRDLVPDGRPLDLVLAADTSGSMGPAERKAQRAFLESMLSLLGPEDRFRLMVCDARTAWFDEAPLPATPENAAQALAFLDRRLSLGWTDLDAALAAASAKAADGTVVVYVGDGIPTKGDADPVACAQRIARLATPAGASFHAVAVGSSYERGVMEAIAARGGSFRETRDDPSRAAAALLTEVAQPPVKDLKVEFEGIRTARVYPEKLPNVAAGTQQIVLGRFLPEGGAAQRGRVTVTGSLEGKPVRFTSDLVVEPGAEGTGNTFLPRLWARRHLDALLAEGRTPAMKDEIVAMSERFGILTPYTSLLVLESDEDRERYGVARRVAMRDGERFFTESRTAAATAALRDGMQKAQSWRANLRRRMLAEIAGLGRAYALGNVTPGFTTWTMNGTIGIGGGAGGPFGGMRPESGVYRARLEDDLQGDGEFDFETRDEPVLKEAKSEDHNESDEDKPLSESEAPFDEVPPDSREPAEPPGSPGFSGGWDEDERSIGPGTPRGDDGLLNERITTAEFGDSGLDLGGLMDRKSSLESMEKAASGPGHRGLGPAGRSAPRRAPRAGGRPVPMAYALHHLFPDVSVPADPPKAGPNEWDTETAALLTAVSDRARLTLAAGGHVEMTWGSGSVSTDDWVWPMLSGTALLSPERWFVETRAGMSEPFHMWLDGERGALATGVRLGRKRPGVERDKAGWIGWAGVWEADFVRQYAKWPARVESRDAAQAVVSLTSPDDAATRVVATIDLAKNVVVRREDWSAGKMSSVTTSSDFVLAGGVWWARLVETRSGAGMKLAGRTVRTVREVPVAEFDAAMKRSLAGQEDVIFLGGAEPPLAEAKQAVHEGRAKFADLLVVSAAHGGTQRWDEAWDAWTKARALVDTPQQRRPGADWLALSLASVSRRGELFASSARALADSVVARGGPPAAALAQRIDSIAANVLAPDERLALADLLDKASDSGAPDALRAWQRDQRRQARAQILAQAGRRAEALDIRRALWKEQPSNLARAQSLMSDLVNAGDTDGALALLDALPPVDAVVYEHLLHGMFEQVTRSLGNAGRPAEMLGIADRWSKALPDRMEPHHARLWALLALDRIGEFDEWLGREIRAEKLPGDDRAAQARLQAAIDHAIGVDWNPYWNAGWWNAPADPEWVRPLGALAQRLARGTSSDIALAGRIMSNHRWQRTEEHRRILDAMRADLTAPGGLEAPKPADLATMLGWFAWDRNSVDAALWRGVTDRVKARWRAPAKDDDRATLLRAVLALLDGHLEPGEVLDVLREELAAAPAARVPDVARLLLQRLAREPWTQALEDECFALALRLVPADANPAEERRLRAASARWLASNLERQRTAAALPPLPERQALPRAERRAREQKARTDARTGLAARLAAAEKDAPATLRPWLIVERLCLLVATNGDAKAIEGEARELLLSAPPHAGPAEGDPDVLANELADHLADVLRDRCVLVLSGLAVRRDAPEGLADRVLTLLRERQEKEPATLDWRYATFRLLVALDRVADIESALRSWIVPADVESGWRIALGWILAESGRMRDAVAQFEAVAALDELGEAEWVALADWYLVLGEDARREAAMSRRYDRVGEWKLQNRLYGAVNRVQRRGDGIPEPLDDEALRIARSYFAKASTPAGGIWVLKNLYETTKDFRVLAALADGAVGHSPEALYGFLGETSQILEAVHEEATCDALRERLSERAKDARTDTDRRGLALLVAQVERRAADVLDQKGPHAARALESLRAARRGTWLPGERALMATYLAKLGAIPDAALAAEQLAQLRDLHAQESPGTPHRLLVGSALAKTEWEYDHHDAAIDGLDAALAERRAATGGRLPAETNDLADDLASWRESRGRHAAAEAWLRAEADRQPGARDRSWYERRIFRTWISALDAGGTVSIGSGETLYREARTRIASAFGTSPPDMASDTLGAFCDLHRSAHRKKVAKTVGADLESSAREMFTTGPQFPRRGTELQRIVAEALAEVAGPLGALTFAVERIESEPAWVARRGGGRGLWQTLGWSMGKWRRDARTLGALEPRLLAVVLRELERDLLTEESSNRAMYGRDDGHFWSEKAGDFAAVARRVIEMHPDSSGRVLRAARYLWGDSHLRDEAVAALTAADARGVLREDGRFQLVAWFHDLRRWKESLPLLDRLTTERPDHLEYAVRRIRTLHNVERDVDGRAALTAAREHFAGLQKRGRGESAPAAFAFLATECGWGDLAVTLYPEAISEQRRVSRGRGDSNLSGLYVGLARALSGLGKHDEAVDAASSAVVIWGDGTDNREGALQSLRDVLAAIPDLPAWTARWEAGIAETGLDAPVMRIAFGDLLLKRKDADGALRHLLVARRLTPDDATVHARIVKAYEAKKDAAGVADALAASLATLPKQTDLYEKLSASLTATGRADDAERAVTGLAEFAPNEPDGHRRLAEIRSRAKSWDDAVTQWRHVVRTRPFEPEGWRGLVHALVSAGRGDDARAALDELFRTPWGAANRAALADAEKEAGSR